MTRTVNANSVKIVPEGSQEGILLSVSQDGKLATNKIDNQGNVDNQESALTSDFISLTDTPLAFEAEKYLKVNAEGNALEFSDISISTDFISLTDTPETLDAGSYLRVNADGNAVEQVKAAPPDGGAGDNSAIQAASNFAGKLPDQIALNYTDSGHSGVFVFSLRGILKPEEVISYHDEYNDGAYRIQFTNNATGTFVANTASSFATPFEGATASLQDIIDGGHAIYHGQKSGTSGVGSLSAIKSSSNFYTELPDTIVCQEGTDEVILTLQRIQTGIIQYRNEDHGTAASDNRFIYFNNNSDGTLSSKNQSYWTGSMSDNSLRWYIENGRALYYGSDPVSSRIGQLEDIATLIPLANQIDIPDAVLARDGGGNLRLLKFTQARSDRFDYQSNTTGGNYLFAFNSTTGTWIGGIHAINVTKEYDDIQGYIAAGRALYYGRTGSNLGQPIANIGDLSDVDTSTIAPINGQVLVYDDADNKWKPGSQSSDFVDLTDTPNILDAGSYLRVNASGDGIEQIKTAPPDGGIGDNGTVQEFSNFNGKLPDVILVSGGTGNLQRATFYGIAGGNKIQFLIWSDNSYYVEFDNDSTGSNGTFKGAAATGWNFLNGETTLQEVIDNGHAIYHGQKSGTSGTGSLSAIKSVSNFYTELPDAIVHEQSGIEYILTLSSVDANGTLGIFYRNEDHGDGTTQDRRITFDNNADGDINPSLTIFFTATDNLRWYIENGRAIYHGHTDNNGSAGAHPKIQAASNFEGILPDGVIMIRSSTGSVINYQLNYVDTNHIYFTHWTDASSANSYYIQFNNDTTGSGLTTYGGSISSQYAPPNGETSLQQLVDNGNVVYHGGRSVDSGASSIKQLTDVDVITAAPSGGQVLVYDDADNKWKPGAQSNDFVDLTDTPTTLDPGSYLRVNSTGDSIEQIKTAPPDGGLGDNSTIQALSNFDGKLPDKLIVNHSLSSDTTADSHGGCIVLELRQVSVNSIIYTDTWADGSYRVAFNNNSTGDGWTKKGSGGAVHILSPIDGVAAPSIQELIDNGYAIYHGQKSGTSGAGSLSHLKTLANQSINGGFYTELPDAIFAESIGDTYYGLFKLHWIKPNSTLTDTSWEVIYRVESFGSSDYYIGFKLDADGTKVTHSGVVHTNATSKNLRWYIENGRAIYNGGYNESNTVSARIAADGTILSSNYDWIDTVIKNGAGDYTITFKPGHFTSVPSIVLGADFVDGVGHITAEYNQLSVNSCVVYIRSQSAGQVIDGGFSIMAQHQDRPIALAAPQYGIKAWGKFDGTGSGSLSFTGGNIQSIVRVSTGLYKVTFINPAPDADYSVSGSVNPHKYGGAYFGVREDANPVTTTDFHIELRDSTNALRDSNRISFQVSY